MNSPCLELSPQEMRRLGYRVIDMLVEHFQGQHDGPVGRKADPSVLRPRFNDPPTPDGEPVDALLDRLQRDVFSTVLHVDHPRFFAFVPSPGNFVSVMADTLVAGFNVFNGSWLGGSAAAALELNVIDWLRQYCGMPETAGGLFVSGGSVANITALVAARKANPGTVAYFSDQTHSSVERGLRVLGFTSEQLRKLPSDDQLRLSPDTLREAIAVDKRSGLKPCCIIVNAGTTNTGAVDPIADLVQFARQEGLWVHADGAYGAASVLSDRGKQALTGLGDVDSLSLDPHKWLFQPFECGCVLVRDKAHLKAAFQIMPDYLQDVHRGEAINPCDYGIQLTRSFRALKVWLSLKTFGLDAFRAAIRRGFELAEYAEQKLRTMSGWEILSRAQMGVVCFRYGASNELQLALVDAMLADEYAFLTSTVLRGATTLRMCTINPRTTEAEIDETLRRLDRMARDRS